MKTLIVLCFTFLTYDVECDGSVPVRVRVAAVYGERVDVILVVHDLRSRP